MIKVGIVGAGYIANKHGEALMQCKNVQVTCVADLDQEKAAELANKCGAMVFADYEKMLDDVDAVWVTTPPNTHAPIVQRLAEAKKHIFCEKPIAASMEDAIKMIKTCKKHGVKLNIGFNMRFKRGFTDIHDAYADGSIGTLTTLFITRLDRLAKVLVTSNGYDWRHDPKLACGMTIESLSHEIDFIRYVGGEIESVAANATFSDEMRSFDDNVAATFTLRNGAIASILASWTSHLAYSARGAVGTNGAVMATGPNIWTIQSVQKKLAEGETETVTLSEEEGTTIALQAEDQAYINALESDSLPPVCGEEGLSVLSASLALLESFRTGNVVRVKTAQELLEEDQTETGYE